MKQTKGYLEYEALLNAFVDLVEQRLGEQVISIVLYGSIFFVGRDDKKWYT